MSSMTILFLSYLVILITWFWSGYFAAKAIDRFVFDMYNRSLSRSAIFLLSFFGYITGFPILFCVIFDALFFHGLFAKRK